MPDNVSSSIRSDMLNSAVNALYRNVGREEIKTSKSAKAALRDDDGRITKNELKDALGNDHVVLSLAEHDDGSLARALNARDVAAEVAERMDRADGRDDDYIDFNSKNGSDLVERIGAFWGKLKDGIFKADLVNGLASGELVVGRQIRTRESAKAKGFFIVELHQNKDGPKLVNGQ